MQALLLLGGTDDDNGDFSRLRRVAQSTRAQVRSWSTLKGARKGDEVWFYFPAPHSAIVAAGTALGDATEDDNWPYVMPVGNVRWLASEITLTELRDRFSQWGWTQRARTRTYLPEDVAAYPIAMLCCTTAAARHGLLTSYAKSSPLGSDPGVAELRIDEQTSWSNGGRLRLREAVPGASGRWPPRSSEIKASV